MPTLFKNIQPDGTMTIYLYGEVSDEGGDGKVSSREIVQAIDYCSENEIAGLVIRVNSIGGDVYPGIAIYNAILRARVPITVAIDGLAASIAGVIALAAPKVTIGRYARIMIHNVSGGGYGNKTELQALIDQIASLEASIADIIGRRMGISREEVAHRYFDGGEHWFTADEAVRLHLADQIYDEEALPEGASNEEIYQTFTNRLRSLTPTLPSKEGGQAEPQIENDMPIIETLKQSDPRFKDCSTEEDVQAVIQQMEAERQQLDEQRQQLEADHEAQRQELEAERQRLEAECQRLRDEAQTVQDERIEADIDEAVHDGRIGEDQRELYNKLLHNDYATGRKLLNQLQRRLRAKEVIDTANQPQNRLSPWEQAAAERHKRQAARLR